MKRPGIGRPWPRAGGTRIDGPAWASAGATWIAAAGTSRRAKATRRKSIDATMTGGPDAALRAVRLAAVKAHPGERFPPRGRGIAAISQSLQMFNYAAPIRAGAGPAAPNRMKSGLHAAAEAKAGYPEIRPPIRSRAGGVSQPEFRRSRNASLRA